MKIKMDDRDEKNVTTTTDLIFSSLSLPLFVFSGNKRKKRRMNDQLRIIKMRRMMTAKTYCQTPLFLSLSGECFERDDDDEAR